MLEEFKKFALRGNVVDLAIGVIIGAAFGTIVNSLVGDVIMPHHRCRHRRARFFQLFYPAFLESDGGQSGRSKKARRGASAWGSFLTVTLNFIIIALVLFLVIRGINQVAFKQAKAAEEKPAPLTKTEELLTEIRDPLKAR